MTKSKGVKNIAMGKGVETMGFKKQKAMDVPFSLDFAFELPIGMEIESNAQGQDCITWSVAGCDDD